MERQPGAHASLCVALDEQLEPPLVVVLRGVDTSAWQVRLAAHYLPRTLVICVPPSLISPPATLDKPTAHSGVNAWVCRGVECLPAITGLDQLLTTLTAARR